ncbi:unnamed protein product [Linum trigynum]|uniref:Uncharacterized protein n=1 Tax=Linum trigynum TaxID=586398 RepID=A0AAV2DJ83_9ROSI
MSMTIEDDERNLEETPVGGSEMELGELRSHGIRRKQLLHINHRHLIVTNNNRSAIFINHRSRHELLPFPYVSWRNSGSSVVGFGQLLNTRDQK